MTPVQLDYQLNQPFRWAGPLLLVLALLALLLTVVYYLALNEKAAASEAQLERMERSRADAGGHPGADTGDEIALEVRHANEVLQRLTLPWEQLFRTVEAAGGNNKVALLALEPDTEKQVVRISGEASDMVALLNYITQLEEQQAFSAVYLQSHQVQQRDPDKPVRFALLAVWRGKS